MKVSGKVFVVLMLTAFVFGTLSTFAVAKDDALMYKGIEMMIKGNEVMKGAVKTIRKGQSMYIQICTDKDCLAHVGQGNKIIDDGLKQGGQGIALLEEGQMQFKKAKQAKNRDAALAGAGKMIEGGRMVQAALNVIGDGVKMNNEALRAKGLASQVEAPTGTILAGVKSGLTGIKQFLEGQRLFLKNK